MYDDFTQEKLFEKRYFQFISTGLVVQYKNLFKVQKFEIKYEDIGTKLIYLNKGVKGWLISAGLFVFVSLTLFVVRESGGDVETGAEIFYLVPGVACLIAYFITYDKSCYLATSNYSAPLKFLIDNPSKLLFDDFFIKFKNKRREYLLEQYGQTNKELPYEQQYNNLTWLLNNDVLSNDEFKEKKAELDAFLPKNVVVSGFFAAKD